MAKGWRRTLNMFSNISNPFGYLLYKMRGSKGDFVFRAANGIRLSVPQRMISPFKEMFFRVPYSEGLPSGLALGPKPVVIDIGANVGFFSFWMLSKHPGATVHAFEPFPPNFSQLKAYKEQHPQFDLHLHPFAVGGETGQFSLHYDASDSFSTSAALNDNQEGSELNVQVVRLQDFLKAQGIGRIDWLKVDCEGAEYGIFKSLSKEDLANVRIVTLEHHDSAVSGENQAGLVSILQSHGFKTYTNGYSPLIWAWRA